MLMFVQFYASTKKTAFDCNFYKMPLTTNQLTPLPVEITMNESLIANATLNAGSSQVNACRVGEPKVFSTYSNR